MNTRLAFSLFVLFIVCLLSSSIAVVADTIISDQIFLDTDWDTVVTHLGPDGTYDGSAHQETTGGYPDEYRQIYALRDPATAGLGNSTQVYSFYKNSYDPSATGGILHLNYMQIDAIQFPSGSNGGSGGSVMPILRQDGIIYLTAANNKIFIQSMPETAWTYHEWSTLYYDNFVELTNFNSHPDFSSSGSPIEFGWYYGVSTPFAEPVIRTVGFDNWEISLAEPSPVPEPASLLLLTTGLGFLGLTAFGGKKR